MILGNMLGTIWYKNQSCPRVDNVGAQGMTGQTDGADDFYDPTSDDYDSFAGELFETGDPATATVKVHRVLVTGKETMKDYWVDCAGMIPEVPGMSDIGMNGSFQSGINVRGDSFEVMADHIYIYVRRPMDRAGEKGLVGFIPLVGPATWIRWQPRGRRLNRRHQFRPYLQLSPIHVAGTSGIGAERLKHIINPHHVPMPNPRTNRPATTLLKLHAGQAHDNRLSHANRNSGLKDRPLERKVA